MIENLDPDAIANELINWFVAHAQQVITWLITAQITVTLGRVAVIRLRHRRHTRNARCVEILAPPAADMPGAEALWGNLVGLLRPAWKRILFGQPHLSFEYVFSAAGVRIRLWVPGVIPQHLVEHAVEAAWPSARTTVQLAAPPIPLTGHALGGQLRIARSERLPIRYEHQTDPVRALIGAVVGMPTWQHAAVQILARPATGRRLAPLLNGGPLWLLRAALDFVTPGPMQSRLHPHHLRQYARDRAIVLEEAAEARAIRDKAVHPRFAVAIRYAVQADEPTQRTRTPAPPAATRSKDASTRSPPPAPSTPATTASTATGCSSPPPTSPAAASDAGSCSRCQNSPPWPTSHSTSPSQASNAQAPTPSHPPRPSRTVGRTPKSSASPTQARNAP
ncbi:hypothetical protein ABGB17_17150 [Sphaerisporangium sp. B11E5]|uniref:hypothetical protein n=1 Tax=Sphaerisporangium sp. B11E5 TaxID=3153563 RepID=UPI00325E6D47